MASTVIPEDFESQRTALSGEESAGGLCKLFPGSLPLLSLVLPVPSSESKPSEPVIRDLLRAEHRICWLCVDFWAERVPCPAEWIRGPQPCDKNHRGRRNTGGTGRLAGHPLALGSRAKLEAVQCWQVSPMTDPLQVDALLSGAKLSMPSSRDVPV